MKVRLKWHWARPLGKSDACPPEPENELIMVARGRNKVTRESAQVGQVI